MQGFCAMWVEDCAIMRLAVTLQYSCKSFYILYNVCNEVANCSCAQERVILVFISGVAQQ